MQARYHRSGRPIGPRRLPGRGPDPTKLAAAGRHPSERTKSNRRWSMGSSVVVWLLRLPLIVSVALGGSYLLAQRFP
jgi:hypothetical protein